MDEDQLSLDEAPSPEDYDSELSAEAETQLDLFYLEQMIQKDPSRAERLRKSADYQIPLQMYWLGEKWETPKNEKYDKFFASYDFEKYYDPDQQFWISPKNRMRTSPYLRDDDNLSNEMRQRFTPKGNSQKLDITAISSIQIKD